jgi:F-type H+-transporting ATPase subunit gamma
MQDAYPIAEIARSGFVSGEYDRVFVAYTDFISAVTQKPIVRQVLPVTAEEVVRQVDEAAAEGVEGGETNDDTLFEPSMDSILEAILPRMTDVQIYQALLESSASEHSSRMMAMRNASDAAGDMIADLSLALNQARQASITREISEIAAGKATLEEG